MTEHFGGDYRTWKTANKKPVRADYDEINAEGLIFPDDMQNVAEPGRAFNFYWHNPKFDRERDRLDTRGYQRVIADDVPGVEPNFHMISRRWRRGPEGTVLWGGKELWFQPADLGQEWDAKEVQKRNRLLGGSALKDEMSQAVAAAEFSPNEVEMFVENKKPKSKK